TKPKIDFPSILFSSVGFGTIIYGFSSAGESKEGFLSPSVYLTIIIGVISIVLFSIRQFKLEETVMNLRVFKYPMDTHAILLIVFSFYFYFFNYHYGHVFFLAYITNLYASSVSIICCNCRIDSITW